MHQISSATASVIIRHHSHIKTAKTRAAPSTWCFTQPLHRPAHQTSTQLQTSALMPMPPTQSTAPSIVQRSERRDSCRYLNSNKTTRTRLSKSNPHQTPTS
eukprot:5717615-Amphidinium_carterae.1